MTVSLLYITCPNLQVARDIAKTLLQERKIACANILPAMQSFFRWGSRIQESKEVAVLLKTQTVLVDQVIARAKSLHPYDVPCVVSWEIDKGFPDFLQWITQETTPL